MDDNELLQAMKEMMAAELKDVRDDIKKIQESTDFLDFMQKQMIEKLRKTAK